MFRALPARPRAGAVSGIQIVWFKRDLRVDDHRPLIEAARRGPVLPLYVVEPDYWRLPDSSLRQQDFIAESLIALHAALARLGQGLLIETGSVIEVLARLHRSHSIAAVHAHEETGNAWTFARDRSVRGWCRAEAIALQEYPQFGVIRGLRERDGWAARWERWMAEPALAAPERLPSVLAVAAPAEVFAAAPVADRTACPDRQPGGIGAGESVLASFLDGRGRGYRGGISSPLSAETCGSRLSPYIAWGCLSLRRIVQRTRTRREAARAAGDARLAASLNAFDQRLHWHCHFIQKLEQRPDIEFENVHRGFDGMREGDFDRQRFRAWAEGRTGYPLIDACMRYLSHTGWLNFRMRAMLMSFAAYPLWLHWREPALHLARLFTDYEPGIHYNQCQMQSGCTGINQLRIYNPVKQARDQDPDGEFVRRWVPELAGLSGPAIVEPWTLSDSERARLGAADYPPPIVDHAAAVRLARQKIAEVRRGPGFRAEADAVQQALGSRRRGQGQRPRKTRRIEDDRQASLF